MRVDTFSYDLPPSLIAQRPAEEREQARLMAVGDDGVLEHRRVGELASLLPEGALVVLNDTRVIPARLLGQKEGSGGKVEILLVRRIGTEGSAQAWRAIGKSSKPLKIGSDIVVGPLRARLLRRADDGLLEVALTTEEGSSVDDAIRCAGRMPLPPYIKRMDDAQDRERYQTVFAQSDGAIAAPTAGLHLTQALLSRIEARCEIATITLHVGLGTFRPVTATDLDDHPMHEERYVVPRATASAIARAKERGAPVVAVGTTVVRALESTAGAEGSGDTRLLIQPGHRFRVTDRLLTNFHLPRSTLLALVCAFGGTERVLGAYGVAVREKYRFFSYGDAMLIARA
jgi:S-adenosylmethionine:tRNA ribosyltransferase-isomerase